MSVVYENRVIRPIRVFTGAAVFDGLLTLSLGGRTLDELNLASRVFLSLSSPSVADGDWPLDEEGGLLINKSAILFAVEIPDLGASLEKSAIDPELRQFARSMLRLQVGAYRVQGYVHSLQNGDPLARLHLPNAHPFFALAPASVQGPGVDCVVPFAALNRSHVLAAQAILSIDAQPEVSAAGASVRTS